MAQYSTFERGVGAQLEALIPLRVMYKFFLEEKEALAQEENPLAAQLEADTILYSLSYDPVLDRFTARPDGATDEVDAVQLLELLDVAERCNIPIHIQGIIISTYVPATFVVEPSGKVSILLVSANDADAAWRAVEIEYDVLGLVEVGLE